LYRPAGDGSEVGGDFYDVFQLSDETWVVAVGDVRGKGVRAAIVTSLARHTLRAAAVQLDHPSAVLSTLNTVLLAEHTDRFCTVALLRLVRAADGWSGVLCCGGHPLPLVVRPGGGPEELGESGTLLGILADPPLPDARVDLRSGDLMLLFTDGVLEARRGAELYGEDRLRAVLSEGGLDSAGTAAQAVLDDVLAFQAGTPRDDIVIVALRVP
jgi:sigma-B regulation protein RsbU (phosphoserine phosphatase)